MIVMKFGGTSVESAAAIERVAGIVAARVERRPLVVVSAMGKTTNKLLSLADMAAKGLLDEALAGAAALLGWHRAEGKLLAKPEEHARLTEVCATLQDSLNNVLRQVAAAGSLTPALWDEVTSHGERLSSEIVTLAFRGLGMNAAHADARTVLITDSRHTQALPRVPQTEAQFQAKVLPQLQGGAVVVMGGFIGGTQDGVTTTLGRGGSDFSASIAGAALGVEEIQIWTDVDGMLTCDPRIAPGGRLVKSISFYEAAELAYFGAKVLHPATVLPAVEKSIPVLILNSRHPDHQGTRIVAEAVRCANPVKSIACKRNITVVNIRSLRMLMAHGFLRRIFEVFDRYRTPVDIIATSEVSVSLTIDSDAHLNEVIEDLAAIAEVTVTRGQSIICLVGDALRETSGVGARVFSALADVNVRMISHGASALNLSLVVDDADLVRAVVALHNEFFPSLDPDVFA